MHKGMSAPCNVLATCRLVQTAAVPRPDNVKIEVSHILVSAEKGALLADCQAQLDAGDRTFSELATLHSECRTTRPQGGRMGWLAKGTYHAAFEAAAYATPVGGNCVCNSPRGLHLLTVTAEKLEASIQHMSVQELAELLTHPEELEDVQLVDVRETWEADMARLPGFQLLPLSNFNTWSTDIKQRMDPDVRTVCLCHHGVRSMNMANYLVSQGYTNVFNVTGGIDAYSKAVPGANVPTY